MRVIFLDIDGVLTTGRIARKLWKQGKREGVARTFDPYSVRWLNWLTKQTGAVFVISSVWRLGKDLEWLRDTLSKQGVVGTVLDKTLNMGAVERGYEIQEWLDSAERVESFVILDDDSDMAHLLPHLVKTDVRYGLTRQKARDAKKFLIGVDKRRGA